MRSAAAIRAVGRTGCLKGCACITEIDGRRWSGWSARERDLRAHSLRARARYERLKKGGVMNFTAIRKLRLRANSGQTLVEFAISAMVFFLLIFSIIDFSYLVFCEADPSECGPAGREICHYRASHVRPKPIRFDSADRSGYLAGLCYEFQHYHLQRGRRMLQRRRPGRHRNHNDYVHLQIHHALGSGRSLTMESTPSR